MAKSTCRSGRIGSNILLCDLWHKLLDGNRIAAGQSVLAVGQKPYTIVVQILDLSPEQAARKHERLQAVYGWSYAEYKAMWERQDGLCAICLQPETELSHHNGLVKLLSVDHDHLTGMIRELLCGACNKAIGLFRENAELIYEAASYVSRHG